MSQRERLLGRQRPSDTYTLRVEDDSEPRRRLWEARTTLRLLQDGEPDPEAARLAQDAVAEAEEQVAACYEHIVVRAMRPTDFEALIGEHKPREGTDDQTWNQDTFPEACFLACAEGEMSGADWQAFFAGNVSDAEQLDIYNTAIRVNARVQDATLPKDWTRTRS